MTDWRITLDTKPLTTVYSEEGLSQWGSLEDVVIRMVTLKFIN